jgi:hypothetical protein
MVVRIRFGRGPRVGRQHRKNQRVALAVASLLTPAAFLSSILALWRIAADMNWTGSFAIPTGVFSHWQVWMGGAAVLQFCAHVLNRYGKSGDRSLHPQGQKPI